MGKMPPPTEHGKGCLLPNDGLNSSVPADCALGLVIGTRSSAIAEGPREALVSRNPATTKHLI